MGDDRSAKTPNNTIHTYIYGGGFLEGYGNRDVLKKVWSEGMVRGYGKRYGKRYGKMLCPAIDIPYRTFFIHARTPLDHTC